MKCCSQILNIHQILYLAQSVGKRKTNDKIAISFTCIHTINVGVCTDNNW